MVLSLPLEIVHPVPDPDRRQTDNACARGDMATRKTQPTDNDLMLPSDVARLAGITADALERYERAGTLVPAMRTPTGRRLFRRGDVNLWLDGRRLVQDWRRAGRSNR